jgi:hypothetical protein
MMQSTNPVISKIEKMLRVARDQEGTPEGETAAALARKWMTAHAVEMSEVDVDRIQDHDPMVEQTERLPRGFWRRHLLDELAEHCACRTLCTASNSMTLMYIYGHRSDVEVTKYLYEVCERQIEVAARAYVKALPGWKSKRSLGIAFRRSAVYGLAGKLVKIRAAEAVANKAGTALVISRGDQVERWMNETQVFKKGRAVDYHHNIDGFQAGREVDLTAGVTGGTTPQLAGGE